MSTLLPRGMILFRVALARVAAARLSEAWQAAKVSERAWLAEGVEPNGFWENIFTHPDAVAARAYVVLRHLLDEGALLAVERGQRGAPEAVEPAFWTSSNADRLRALVNSHILIREDDLDAVLKGKPVPSHERSSAVEQIENKPVKGPKVAKRGRRYKEGVHEFWSEVCLLIHNEGIPANEADFYRRLAQWSDDNMGEEAYSLGSLRVMIGPLLRRLRGGN